MAACLRMWISILGQLNTFVSTQQADWPDCQISLVWHHLPLIRIHFYFRAMFGIENWNGWTDFLYCLPLTIPVGFIRWCENSFHLVIYPVNNCMEWLCSEGYRDLKEIQWKRRLSLIYVCVDTGMRNVAYVLTLSAHVHGSYYALSAHTRTNWILATHEGTERSGNLTKAT